MPCECYLRFNWYSPTKCLYCFELDHNAVDEVGSWELGVGVSLLRGFAKKKNSKIREYYGSGWVGFF